MTAAPPLKPRRRIKVELLREVFVELAIGVDDEESEALAEQVAAAYNIAAWEQDYGKVKR